MKRLSVILLLASFIGFSGAFAESKISYGDVSYLNKEVNSGHYISSLVLGGTMNLYAGNTGTGIVLTTVKMLTYGMMVYGYMNFFSSQDITVKNYNLQNGYTTMAPSINYTSLGILLGGILLSGLTSAYDISSGLSELETRKAEILRRNNIELNIDSTGGQNQISVGIKF